MGQEGAQRGGAKWHDLGNGPQWAELDDLPGVLWRFDLVGGRDRTVGIMVLDPEGVTEDALRAVPIRRVEASIAENARARAENPPTVHETATVTLRPPTKRELRVTVPKTRRFPDSFYEKVASLYWECVAGGVHPTPAISSANGVPRSTVRAWITEARRRGLLAPARKQGSTG
jgi:hypothetical protein